MMKIEILGNIVRDAEIKQNAKGENFTSATVAFKRGVGDKERTVFGDFTQNGENIAKSLTKGREVLVICSDIETVTYDKKDGSGKGEGFRLANADVVLDGTAYLVTRARLVDDVKLAEGKDFAMCRALANVYQGKDKDEAVVASSFLLGKKFIDAVEGGENGRPMKKGKVVTLSGPVVVHAYETKNGPGAELRFIGNPDIRLGPDAKPKADAPVSAPAEAVEDVIPD